MNPSNISMPCTIGDIIKDSMTSVEGQCAGFKVRSDGSVAVCIAWNAHGDPRYLWIAGTRVTAGRSPEQIAADVERARTEANNVLGRQLSESEAYDARQPEQPPEGTEAAERPARRGRRRAANAAEGEVQRREGEQS